MEKLLPIINLALSAIAMIVSIVVLLTVMQVKTALTVPEEEVEVDPDAIPLVELEEFNVDDSFLIEVPDAEDPTIKYNAVFSIGFALHTTDEGYTDAKAMLESQGTLILSRVSTIFKSKDTSYFQDPSKMRELTDEVTARMHELLGNEAVTETYFQSDPILRLVD